MLHQMSAAIKVEESLECALVEAQIIHPPEGQEITLLACFACNPLRRPKI